MDILTAEKSDKKDIKRFYKNNHYSASFMGNDQCFMIKDDNAQIIAAVIVSVISDKPFLHALVVNQNERGTGRATQLLEHCQSISPMIYCFADLSLNRLYIASNFKSIDQEQLPASLHSRFQRYKQQNNTLTAFYWDGRHGT